jgi:hypothetical protein
MSVSQSSVAISVTDDAQLYATSLRWPNQLRDNSPYVSVLTSVERKGALSEFIRMKILGFAASYAVLVPSFEAAAFWHSARTSGRGFRKDRRPALSRIQPPFCGPDPLANKDARPYLDAGRVVFYRACEASVVCPPVAIDSSTLKSR